MAILDAAVPVHPSGPAKAPALTRYGAAPRAGSPRSGTAAQLRQVAGATEEMAGTLAKIFELRTGNAAFKWFSGPDFWFTAEQAVEAGLADEILPASSGRE
jgi:ATP-dependent protease ClpP protease subunit